jgi:hypothetical protein
MNSGGDYHYGEPRQDADPPDPGISTQEVLKSGTILLMQLSGKSAMPKHR